MLSGQDVESFYLALEHYPLLAIGCNCGAGPEQMGLPLKTLAAISRFPLFCMANNGLPDENGRYGMKPEQFAEAMMEHVRKGLLNIAGGCCGTSVPHIRELAKLATQAKPLSPLKKPRSGVCGAEALFFDEIEPPVLVGERANSIGSKIFRELVAQGKWDEAVGVARRQAKAGAHVLDICLANPERDETSDSAEFLSRVVKAVRTPLMVDTTNFAVAEAAAKACPGKIIWNSVNLEHGPERLLQAAQLNRRFGTMLVVGCIDENKEEGMALTSARKLEVARRARKLLADNGVPDRDIIFDALVFPVASGQEKYATAAAETAAAIALLKKEFPDCFTLLGVSNVSFGLPPVAREALNSLFLHHCVRQGLDMAIVNTEKLRRHASLSEEEKSLGSALLEKASAERAAAFAGLYRAAAKPADKTAASLPPEEFLRRAILEGACEGVAKAALELAGKAGAQEVINGPLSGGMAEVGKLFAKGELIVTEVLQSAQAMKTAVDALEPELKKSASGAKRGKLLLATVKGDVHDIGKNLVRIIFESNGFDVSDVGVKVPNEDIVGWAKQSAPDIIGLSGLLTRSAEAMISVAEDLSAAGIRAPLLIGGAA
ncbi:MAG TPA: dihydropteroate synthase, partial [Elusimicrobiales bacterium]|nr:dihydropteroate synthase [Elusimicrobiales bacterium]